MESDKLLPHADIQQRLALVWHFSRAIWMLTSVHFFEAVKIIGVQKAFGRDESSNTTRSIEYLLLPLKKSLCSYIVTISLKT